MIQIQTITHRAERLFRQATSHEYTALQCDGCYEEVDISVETNETIPLLARLIEHCVYEHMGRASILGVQPRPVLVGGYALAASVGATPQTQHEEEWRQSVVRHPASQRQR
jgi:hypothetical protein